MTGTIWLIAESQTDYEVVRAIIKQLQLPIRVKRRNPSGKTPGLSRLARELPQLISDVRAQLTGNDCIVVLHDDDTHRQPDRSHYDQVREICQREKVKLIVAHDEIEAWLLSDSGVCEWLKVKVQACNAEAHPSQRLESLLQKRYRLKYPRDLESVLRHLRADGTNASFQQARKELLGAPCLSST